MVGVIGKNVKTESPYEERKSDLKMDHFTHRSFIGINSNIAVPTLAFQFPDIDFLLIKYTIK